MKLLDLFEEKSSYQPPVIDVGDDILVGKWKNKKAKVTGFSKDDHNQPVLKTNKGDQKLFKPRIAKLDEILENSDKLSDDDIEQAAWWLTRWISGSMRDPDWDDSWTKFGIDQAFDILHKVVGNQRSVGKPLWRSLSLSEPVAKKIVKMRVLPPYRKSPFQSFSLSQKIAKEFAEEIFVREGSTHVLISAQPAPDNVLFSMADLKASRNQFIGDALSTIKDWHHQQEVIVRVTKPLPLLSAIILPS